MNKIFDTATGLLIGDPDKPLFSSADIPDHTKIQEAASSLILSASGWRKIFAEDGDEESREAAVSREDICIALAMAYVYSVFVQGRIRKARPRVAVGIDTRFTGPQIAKAVLCGLLSQGIEAEYVFISAAPEIMAYVKEEQSLDGFIYVSASHNPVGHNGIKFGHSSGGVIGGEDSGRLINHFKQTIADYPLLKQLCSAAGNVSAGELALVFRSVSEAKRRALEKYRQFAKTTIAGCGDSAGAEHFFQFLQRENREIPIGIIAELNGSARTRTIDVEFLRSSGFLVEAVNAFPGEITHRIVPEGDSLQLCRSILEEKYRENRSFQIGYVPDNDGDRGNIVYVDHCTRNVETLEAQEVFALAVLAELSFLRWRGGVRIGSGGRFADKVAVAVNGPTSMRIERIAGIFGAEVFRAEVGEANVVNLAEALREKGYTVPILGEGSNGGNITYPASVRDPLNTIFALFKLLLLRDKDGRKGMFNVWKEMNGLTESSSGERFFLSDVRETLPRFATSSAFEKDAVMRIQTQDHGVLKRAYERIFLEEWAVKKDYLKEAFGFCSWKEINYESTHSREGFGPEFRSGTETGGLKIQFYDSAGNVKAFIWMRGSGTEPVFRVLADIEGGTGAQEKELLAWHRNMITRADNPA